MGLDPGMTERVENIGDAAVFLLRHYSGDLPVNIGTGLDVAGNVRGGSQVSR
jgi:hypothetical protein